MLQFLHRGDEAIQAERRPDAGQHLLRVLAGEVVVTPAAADAADAGQVGEERFVDRAGVVVEPAGDAQVDLDAALGNARRVFATASNSRSRRSPSRRFLVRMRREKNVSTRFEILRRSCRYVSASIEHRVGLMRV